MWTYVILLHILMNVEASSFCRSSSVFFPVLSYPVASLYFWPAFLSAPLETIAVLTDHLRTSLSQLLNLNCLPSVCSQNPFQPEKITHCVHHATFFMPSLFFALYFSFFLKSLDFFTFHFLQRNLYSQSPDRKLDSGYIKLMICSGKHLNKIYLKVPDSLCQCFLTTIWVLSMNFTEMRKAQAFSFFSEGVCWNTHFWNSALCDATRQW